MTPVLGGLEWMEGDVPTPHGKVHVYRDSKTIKVSSDEGIGTLHFKYDGTPKANKGTLKSKNGEWTLPIEPGTEVIVTLE